MPFEYFMLLLSIVGAAACCITPFILKHMDRKVNKRLNNLHKEK